MNPRITQIKTQAETSLVAALASRADSSKTPFALARRRAADLFAEKGLPHRRVEAWHYTDLRNLMREAWPLAERAAPAKVIASEGLRVTIEDGVCTIAPSALPAGLSIRPLRDALHDASADFIATLFPDAGADDAAVALNAGLARDGVVIEVAAGANIAAPLEITFTTSAGEPRSEVSRCLLVAGGGSSITIVETHISAARVQRNSALVCNLADDAHVDHIFMSTRAAPEHHISTLIAELGARANFQSFAFVSGGELLRRQCFIRQTGEYVKIGLRGASLLRGKQHADTTLVIDHAVPHGESRELFKHIVMDEATGVYQGKVLVRPHAQKTDGGMKSQALLLSDGAAMYNKPELEIFADDVVCGHGATIGQLDDDQLFYLMSRGLPKSLAEAMLIEAFAREAIEFIANDELRTRCEVALRDWLEARA